MNIHNTIGKCVYDCRRNQPEKSCQHNEIDAALFQFFYNRIFAEEIFFIDDHRLYAVPPRNLHRAGLRAIAHEQRNLRIAMELKMLNEDFSVGACTRSENGDAFHDVKVEYENRKQKRKCEKQCAKMTGKSFRTFRTFSFFVFRKVIF